MEQQDIGPKQYIDRSMLLNDILEKHPEAAPIFMGYGLHCVGCSFSNFDTLEVGAKLHGMSDEEINMMIKDANEIIKMCLDREND